MICPKTNLNRLKWLINSLLYRPIHTDFDPDYKTLTLEYATTISMEGDYAKDLIDLVKIPSSYKPFYNDENMRKMYLTQKLLLHTQVHPSVRLVQLTMLSATLL